MEESKFISESEAITKRVTDAQVTNAHEFEALNHVYESIRLLKNKIKKFYKEGIAKAHDLHKTLLAQQKGHIEPLEQAEASLKGKLNPYIEEQARIRRAAERAAQEEAERLRKEEEERILAEAETAYGNGASKEHVDNIMDQEVAPPAPEIIIPEAPKYDAQVLGKETWTFKVVNFDKIPREYLKVDDKKIKDVIKALKGDTKIPGIIAFKDDF